MRTVYLLEIPTPYREPLLERIAARPGIDLHVLYCAERDPLRQWTFDLGSYPREFLPGTALGGRRGGLSVKINPAVTARLDELRPEVVVISGYAHPTMLAAMRWCRRRRIPYVLVSESQDLTRRAPWRRVVKYPVVRWAIRNAAGFLATGSHSQSYLERRGAPPDRIHLFPNAPDVDSLTSEASRLRRTNVEVAKRCLFVGRLVDVKNVETLIAAFELLARDVPGASLVIAGDGPLRRDLEERAAGMSVEFRGHVDGLDLIELYASSRCFALPSTYEPWGVVVHEALACGVPVVVASTVGCAVDLVKEGTNGFVVAPHDVKGMCRALGRVLTAPDWIDMAAASRESARRWGYALCVDSFVRAVSEEVSFGPSAAP